MKGFFNQLQRSVLWAALPGNFIALVLLWQAPLSFYLQALISVLQVLVVAINLYYLFDKLNEQFLSLANLVEALNAGDYTLRAKGAAEKSALGDLVLQVNRLADNLSTTRFEYKESQLLLAKLIKQIGVVIFACDENDTLSMANPAAELFFAKSESKLVHLTLNDLNVSELQTLNTNQLVSLTVNGKVSRWHLYKDGFFEGGKQQTLFILSDLELVLGRQEQKAWKDLVRVLSHEINNSLSPIISLTSTIDKLVAAQQFDDEDKADISGGLSIIGERATRLKNFIHGYRSLTSLPEPNKAPTDLVAIVTNVAQLVNYPIELSLPSQCVVYVDAAQIEQCLINIFKNAHEAAPSKPIRCELKQTQSAMVELEIKDEGAGIQNPDNLFVPLYTTKPNGTGIGLALCKQIVTGHQGLLTLTNHQQGGCVATLALPLS